ncbi:MAG TPA: phenylalanine--tRNA ligase subunit beta [Flavobacteriaceae bacterium]|nr:phenylalanine--tRNA ligase subunit beta [Flavobacteriaceae bacterium]
MKVSYNWLKDYLDINKPVDEVAEILTNLGLEVEKVEDFESIKGSLEGIVVGEVLSCKKHPNADRLKLTNIDLGKEGQYEIVCGAPNISKGQKVPVATVGSVIYTNSGEKIKISKSKIRGVVSNGMVCAEDEIGLGDSHDGIMVLDKKIKSGTPLNEIYKIEKDKILEIGLTPNRSDAMSHYGVARDLKAFFDLNNENVTLKLPSLSDFTYDDFKIETKINVKDSKLSPLYAGIIIKNIEVKESPKWIKNKIKSIGYEPINNIVDITNYVLHEIGQPLHAFDLDKITNIEVKTLPSKTNFKTLDGNQISLSDEDIIICSENDPLCLGGIFGGLDSGVTDKTKNLFLESAIFNPTSIRKSSKRHSIFTEASFRFERGVDPEMVIYALKRASILIKNDCPESISSNIIQENNLKLEDKKIYLRYERINSIAGKLLDKDVIVSILNSLDITIEASTDDGLNVISPHYRADVNREIDIIEEILRVYGYNNIESSSRLVLSSKDYILNNDKIINDIVYKSLIGSGFNEIMTNSICSPQENQINKDIKPLEIINPQGIELSNLRVSLLPGMLDIVAFNTNRQNKNLKLFELGNTYQKINKDNIETRILSISISGEVFDESWAINDKTDSFFYLKGVISKLCNDLSLKAKFTSKNDSNYSKKLIISNGKDEVGFIGELNKKLLHDYSISTKVCYAEINISKIEIFKSVVKYKEISKFPSSRRDISMIVDSEVSFDIIKKLSFDIEKNILKEVNLFDVYKDKSMSKDKKSYAVSFIFNDSKKTLTDKHIDQVMKKIMNKFNKDLNAQIRDK